MANKEKIMLMTELAMYRKKNEHIFQVNKYFGYDYIVWNLLLAAVRYTICAGIIAALFVIFRAETVFYNVNISGITNTLKIFAIYYFVGLAIYLIISFIVYRIRYNRARKGMLHYASKLKRLAKIYNYIDKGNMI